MSTQEKIDAIISALQEDAPTTNTGKIVQSVLIQGIPSLPSDQLDNLCNILGINDAQADS